jgi:hypothetical protein
VSTVADLYFSTKSGNIITELIWTPLQIISSPNLESFPNQVSKVGYYQTPKRVLTDLHQPQKQSLRNLFDDDTRPQFEELSRSTLHLQIWLLIYSNQTPNE